MTRKNVRWSSSSCNRFADPKRLGTFSVYTVIIPVGVDTLNYSYIKRPVVLIKTRKNSKQGRYSNSVLVIFTWVRSIPSPP